MSYDPALTIDDLVEIISDFSLAEKKEILIKLEGMIAEEEL